ncbi:hypothetical protein IV203_028426 [Nitzschia inconspicua]|uniref:Uncharacterized protein n=1 Tax=Nitzschia inconspicua TaxID=303405 RepID=A0A9K3PZX1_9STRA|nr:hypothetical protein IV203_028426 [Nitzschia inconspicua]
MPMAKSRTLEESQAAQANYAAAQSGEVDPSNKWHQRNFHRRQQQQQQRKLEGDEDDSITHIGPKLAGEYDGGGMPGFYHGVASGDPLPDAIILWYIPMHVQK